MVEHKASRGLEGALVKLCRGGDYELTVTGRTQLTPNYLRLRVPGVPEGELTEVEVAPQTLADRG